MIFKIIHGFCNFVRPLFEKKIIFPDALRSPPASLYCIVMELCV